jgi:glycosyltransferase involved in cell wall biosynthesis
MIAPPVRVAVLWEYLAGYIQAALRGLTALDNTEVLVVQRSREPNAEYALELGGACEVIDLTEAHGDVDLVARVRAFAPDVTLITTNKDPRYDAVARDNHRRGKISVWGSEIPPRSFWRDSYGMIRGRLGALRYYDAALVAGAVSHAYARRVGFSENRIFEGLLTCDAGLFRPIGIARHQAPPEAPWPRVFLFVGQFIPRKGLDVLLDAYRRYRAATPDPWDLWCAGAGPLRELLEGQPGVRVLDFVPPAECARLMGQAGAFVLPSRIDHWGIVIHEAACAGLPVIASRTSYASADLVEEGRNGHTFSSSDVEGLARLLVACADAPRARIMGERSLALSHRFDPGVFARLLTEDIPRMLRA